MEIILLILVGVPVGFLVVHFVRKVFFGEEIIRGIEYACPNCGERFICRVNYNRYRKWEPVITDNTVRTCPNCGCRDFCRKID